MSLLGLVTTLIAILFSTPLLAATKSPTPFRVAYSSISGSAVIPWIAVDKGIFAKYDLDVELIYVAGSSAIAVFKNDLAYSKKIIKERLKIDDALVQEEPRQTYLNYVPRVPYPNRAGIALIKTFLEKSELQLRPFSVDDQIDGSIVRGLEQSGFFSSLYSTR
jgi:hypothetical protein